MRTTTEAVYINGRWVASKCDRVLVVRSPNTEEIVGQVPDADAADIDAAVASRRQPARHSFLKERRMVISGPVVIMPLRRLRCRMLALATTA